MTDDLRWYSLTKKRAEIKLVSAFHGFRREGIEPVLIKGWAAARSYPANKPRYFGDIDLAVSSAEYDTALRLIADGSPDIRGVDLHRELRHLDTVAWSTLFSNSQLVDLESEKIRVLSAEDHLRVLCVHWLTDGAESRERLWDIFWAVDNRPADFDWAKCLEVVSENRRSWMVCTIGLAHKYLGLELDGFPFADEAKRLPKWLTRSVEEAWSSELKLRGLDESITDRTMFIRQLRKRLPPNAIQATLNCEGKFDDRSRFEYQIRDMFGRFIPSVKRQTKAILNQYRWRRAK